ncbi:hypothetical protein RchiOBHm_Chr7g0222621 [Rosa chinensis]|uniref:Uncharacterized protein n=1 Tax=Rosa chinensis TaxID=74649 RepID=A0A2P6PDB8_ROSCH|nr:hypothetical protein RchiOBHm_Chr7g0222621 [Rosa chinensis]
MFFSTGMKSLYKFELFRQEKYAQQLFLSPILHLLLLSKLPSVPIHILYSWVIDKSLASHLP